MRTRILVLWTTVFLSLVVLMVAPRVSDGSDVQKPLSISKVSFLIHPVCWDLALAKDGKMKSSYPYQVFTYRGGALYDEKEFYEILDWERRVNKKQEEYIQKMGRD